MKRLFVLVLALMLCASAVAEGFSPAMFLGSRGLMVMDQDRLNSMGGGSSGMEMYSGLSICLYGAGSDENSSDAIIFTDNGALYVAFDMMSMFSGEGSGNAKALGQTYLDLCKAYDFEMYAFGGGELECFCGDLTALVNAMTAASDVTAEEIETAKNMLVVETKEEYLQRLEEFLH